jgi:glycosyltransferase involved in cell wall biosynthesis
MKPRLLVVPQIYAEDILVRQIEFARRLTRFFEVYCLKWTDALHVDGATSVRRRWAQLRASLGAVFARRHLNRGADGIAYVTAPHLQQVLLHRTLGFERARSLSEAFNRRVLEGVLQDYGISHVVLASDDFAPPDRAGLKAFYDLADWFPEEKKPSREAELIRSRLRNIAGRVQGIFAVSEPLCEKLKADCGIDAVPLPNGADLNRLRSVAPSEVHAVRCRWGLEDKFVIGYIGNHGSYTGVDFAVNVVQAVRKRIPNAVLLLVGPANHWRPVLEDERFQGVVSTGAIPPAEIAAYFHAIDLGILAQEKSSFTDFAFQIKVVEYSACRRFVVSTPLRTWQRLRWPNILLVDRNVEAWVDAICRVRHGRWSPEWDALAEPYDWNALAQKMAAVLLASR